MAIEAVKVPADVQVEEKIFGPISLRQLGIVMLTGGVSYVTWSMLKKAGNTNQIFTIASWIPFILGLGFAFVKVNDVSMFRLLLLCMEKMDKPMVRTFGPRKGVAVNIRVNSNKKEEAAKEAQPTQAPTSNLEELSQLLDKGIEGVAIETAIEQGELPSIATGPNLETQQMDTVTDVSADLPDIEIAPLSPPTNEEIDIPEEPTTDVPPMMRDVLPPA